MARLGVHAKLARVAHWSQHREGDGSRYDDRVAGEVGAADEDAFAGALRPAYGWLAGGARWAWSALLD